MNTQTTPNRRATWTPPTRPDWVRRVNEEGTCLDAKGIIPLDARSLIDHATRNTGLSNFGTEDWREPFEVICRSLDADAKLTLMGRIMTRSDMLMMLEGRLHPRSKRPSHRYELGGDDAKRAEREVFRRYQEFFNVPSEV